MYTTCVLSACVAQKRALDSLEWELYMVVNWEISKQPSVDSVMYLLVFVLIKIYNEKEQAEQGKI